MQQYPYYSPQILTDAVFTQYGGQTGTSSANQRQAAYLLAEEQMTEHLSAFLIPTTITGSAWYKNGTLFETEFGYIRNIKHVSARVLEDVNPLDTQIYTGTALIRNSENGYIDILFPNTTSSNYWVGIVYDVSVAYESGLSSGTVTSPIMLSALTKAAQIHLNEWDASLANEGSSDVGIESFSNQSYAEKRKFLGNTIFGNSPAAQYIARVTRKYRAKPTIGLHR